MFFIDVPQRVPNDLVGDRIDAPDVLRLQPELARDRKVLGRHVTCLPAVEDGAFCFTDLEHRDLRFVALKMDFEIAERIDLERAARMHDDGRVGGLDHRGTDDAIAGDQQSAIVDWTSRGSLEIRPVNFPRP